GVDDHLGITARVESVPGGFELPRELLEVVDLAVVDHRDAIILVEERLLASGEVDDRQASVGQRDVRLQVHAALVGPAVHDGIRHQLQLLPVEWPGGFTSRCEQAGYPAHERFSWVRRSIWREAVPAIRRM